MLVIRMQRTGRRGHAMFRLVVQDSRQTPTSGKIVAHLGSYDPHLKLAQIDLDKTDFYLSRGAQPSKKIIKILIDKKVKLPSWLGETKTKQREVKNPSKRRSTAPVAEAPENETSAKAPEPDQLADANNASQDESSPAAAKQEQPAEEASTEA
jgi:ribosomal protein S16